MRVWLIPGASRGLGREIARQALDRGDAVVATARQPDRTAGALPGYGDRLLAVTRAVLPAMRAQKSGRILNISSVGGFAQVPGRGIYGATKFAVEGLSEALRGELEPLGIGVVIIEPGGFRTGFLDDRSLHRSGRVIADYASTAGRVRAQAASRNGIQPNDPARGAAAIVTIATVADPPLRLQLGADSVAAVEGKLRRVTSELNQWRELAVSTARDDDA